MGGSHFTTRAKKITVNIETERSKLTREYELVLLSIGIYHFEYNKKKTHFFRHKKPYQSYKNNNNNNLKTCDILNEM